MIFSNSRSRLLIWGGFRFGWAAAPSSPRCRHAAILAAFGRFDLLRMARTSSHLSAEIPGGRAIFGRRFTLTGSGTTSRWLPTTLKAATRLL